MPTSNIHQTLAKLIVPIEGLVHYGRNPRRGDVAAIAESLTFNGQYKPIVVRTGTMEVLAGNHTLKAARELGWDQIAATFVTVDDEQAARIVLVDNRTNDLAEYDPDALVSLLTDLPDLAGTAFNQDALDALIYGIEQEPADASDTADDIPEHLPTIAQPGDLFQCGEHRVICGDGTDPKVLARLLGGETPDLMWTDPPYGVSYTGGTADKLTIENDGADGLEELLAAAFTAAVKVLRPGAPVYVAHSDTRRVTFETALRDAGFVVRQNLIWVKNSLVLGHADYQYQHEPILEAEAPAPNLTHEPVLYGFTPGGEGRLGRGGSRWYGTNNRTTVFEFPKPAASRAHPTMKPVKLILAMLANSIRPGGIVLDPFGGSGSTLIAAHFHGAYARLVELDPKYVDAICARYQQETGELPRRGGKPVDFGGEEE